VKAYGENILPAFEENLAKLRRAYELGEINVLELAQIRERMLTTQSEALAALGEYYAAVAELEALAGTHLSHGGKP
jgi:cobalt-zinc-cadmium efflux system outer membrane protein